MCSRTPRVWRIAITGASGLVGSALQKRLRADGHEVIPVVRRTPTDAEIGWSIDEQRIDTGAFDGIDAVVHLAGAGIGGWRWTDKYKRTILRSRTIGTGLVAKAIAEAKNPPEVLVSGSAVGFYGPSLADTFTESDSAGTGFLSEVCQAWETTATAAETPETRVGIIRTGIILSDQGGVLKKLTPLYRFRLGGIVGSGDQWVSWIHIDDEVGAVIHLLTNHIAGPVNLTAPNPVTYRELNTTMGDVMNRSSSLPIPDLGPKLLLGTELADSLLFTGQRVLPTALQTNGYEFLHPTLDGALRDILVE